MKVAVWYNNRDIRIEEVPTPVPGPGEMLVKVMACGICGSDIVEWYRLPRAPLVPGHEMGGEIVSLGDEVRSFNIGDRVFIAPKVPCMTCYYCLKGHFPVCTQVKERLPGAFSEYVLVPEALIENGAYRLPASMSYDHGTFIEPLACVIHAQGLAGILAGQTVMVMGCGMSGLLHVMLAKISQCKVIAVDINAKRLEIARKLGAEIIINADGLNRPDAFSTHLKTVAEKLPDVIVLCTSAVSAVEQAWKAIDKGGVVVFFAVPSPDVPVSIPINDFWMKEIRLITSYYCGPPDIKKAIELIDLEQMELDALITHRLPLKDTPFGFQRVQEGDASIKVIIHPNR